MQSHFDHVITWSYDCSFPYLIESKFNTDSEAVSGLILYQIFSEPNHKNHSKRPLIQKNCEIGSEFCSDSGKLRIVLKSLIQF